MVRRSLIFFFLFTVVSYSQIVYVNRLAYWLSNTAAKDSVIEWITEYGGGGSFSGDMDDIPDGTTYVKTHNDFTDADSIKLLGIETGATKYPDTGEQVFTDALKTKLDGIAAGAEVNVNADWNSSSGDSQILNKPTILALGETSGTAYRGDRGKIAYDHSQTAHAPSDAINKTTADGYYEPLFTTQLIGSGANYFITGNTNIIVYHTGDENASVLFPVNEGLPSGTIVRVMVVNIPNGYSLTLDFSDKLNWNPQTSSGESNPVLTDTDNGYSAIFILTDLGGGEIWWQQLL